MKPMIKKIIELYTDNEIAQLLTAENMTQKVMGQNVNLRGKSLETYDELFKELKKMTSRLTLPRRPPPQQR